MLKTLVLKFFYNHIYDINLIFFCLHLIHKIYLFNKIKSQKLVSLILGGPNKYYSFDKDQLIEIFNEMRSNFIAKGYKVIVIPSIRTPKMIMI